MTEQTFRHKIRAGHDQYSFRRRSATGGDQTHRDRRVSQPSSSHHDWLWLLAVRRITVGLGPGGRSNWCRHASVRVALGFGTAIFPYHGCRRDFLERLTIPAVSVGHGQFPGNDRPRPRQLSAVRQPTGAAKDTEKNQEREEGSALTIRHDTPQEPQPRLCNAHCPH